MINAQYNLIYGFNFSKKENYPISKHKLSKDVLNELVKYELIKKVNYDFDQFYIGEIICHFTSSVNPFVALNEFENKLTNEHDIIVENDINEIISFLKNDICDKEFHRKDVHSAIKYFKNIKTYEPVKFSLLSYRW